MLTPAGLAQIKTYANGIGPWKPMIVPVKCSLDAVGNWQGHGRRRQLQRLCRLDPAAGHDAGGRRAQGGPVVHEYTFRNEKGYYNLPLDAVGDPVADYLTHFRLGVDGVFSDFSDTALEGRNKFLKEKGM